MRIPLANISSQLPEADTFDFRSENKSLFAASERTCIVIDDDPTGNQTVYDIPLLTAWSEATIRREFTNKTPAFFVLTNSRSLSEQQSTKIFEEISENILRAAQKTGRKFTIISRSDSTLRGHFSELEAIKKPHEHHNGITVFAPVMFEGGRVTVNDTHYICENDELIPVTDTPFSKDHTFAYTHANLKGYINEKTNGKVSEKDITSLSVKAIRTLSIEELCQHILTVPSGTYLVLNALNYNDLDKVTHALLLAEKKGKNIFYRTSSSFVPAYIGQQPKPLLTPQSGNSKKGGLTIVGSYVAKSSLQLQYVLENNPEIEAICLDVSTLIKSNVNNYLASITSQIDHTIDKGRDVIVYTSRTVITGENTDATIQIASTVSQALVSLVNGLNTCPKYVLAKGGITSHDLAIKGLHMKRSEVVGQLLPGIPVWKMGTETRFPDLLYIVFPGNVGDQKTLSTLIQKLSN